MIGESRETVRVIDVAKERVPLSIVESGGAAHAVLWPGNGARLRSFNLLELLALGRTVELSHDNECAYYVHKGSGVVRDLDSDQVQLLSEGSMVHIGAGDRYRIEASEAGLTAIGGTVPVDPAFYEKYLG